MGEKSKDKTIHITRSRVGIVGDNAQIRGDIHFHHHPNGPDDAENPEYTEPSDEGTAFDASTAADILHLSDLHFVAGKDSNPIDAANRWYGQLTDDLCNELMCERLHAVIISGDIGNFSIPEEYQAAELFLKKLCDKFGLDASHLVIAPGNHDLNREISEDSYPLVRRKHVKGNLRSGRFFEESKNVIAMRDDATWPQRFQNFIEFHQNATGRPYSLEPKEQATLHHLPELNLLICSFNSAWEADHHFRTRISIHPDAVALALDRIRERSELKKCLKFAVWHHPLSSPNEDRIKEHGFMQRLAQSEFHACLHGHIHKVDAGLFRYDMSAEGRRIHVIGAGAFGAPVEEWTPGYPLQYNLLRLSGNTLRVETRRRIELNGAWEPDHMWRQGKGQPNLPYYDIPLPIRIPSEQTSDSKKTSGSTGPSGPSGPSGFSEQVRIKTSDPSFEKEIRAYCAKAESLHDSLPAAGFATHLKAPMDIEDIYIPLRAMVNLKGVDEVECYGDARAAERHLAGCDAALEIPLIEAFSQAGMRGKKGLVILGDPGSGKTTHMKRMLLWLLRQGPETMGLPEGMLPVFLPLRELKRTDVGIDRFIQDQLASRHLQMRPDFGKRLLDRGNLLFLLDGLDEVADLAQREEVSGWIEEAFTDYPNCRFVVTCRFAGYSPSVRMGAKFLEMHVRPLSKEDAERFVRTWYVIVEKSLAKDIEQAESIAREKAGDLIDHLRQPDFRARRVFEMTRNPLLLTNICLVHRHRGSLPRRRARLYEECIDVLLEHWRGAKKLKLGVNALQGRLALQPAAFWLHQEEGRIRAPADQLAPHIEPALKEMEWTGGDALEFLKVIQNESGLLTGWDHENYGFMHLGFQEYLAAREIRSLFQQEMNEEGQSAMLRELAGHFGESWWQEVALLLLGLEDPPLFVPYMREVVRLPAFAGSAELVDMCLDDAVKPSAKPFIELLNARPGADGDRWKGQLLALRIAERFNVEGFEAIAASLKDHPYEKIRQWIQERFKQALQDVIRPEPSGYELVLVKGGTFMMGSDEYTFEKPIHEVELSDFYMGRYPVTNEEYGRFLSATGYKEPEYWADRQFSQPGQPVVGVSWHDAQTFAQWAGLQLPSEAQWEYACRAGTTTRYYTGDSKADLDRAGWYDENSGNKLHPVGEKEPNDFGLYDMHGNVYEWCEDHWHEDYKGAPSDGSAWLDFHSEEGAYRVIRGGAWYDGAAYCRAASRNRFLPGLRSLGLGFRLVRLPGQPGEPDKTSR